MKAHELVFLFCLFSSTFFCASLTAQKNSIDVSNIPNTTKVNIEELLEIRSDHTGFQSYKLFSKDYQVDFNKTHLTRLKLRNPKSHAMTCPVDFGKIGYGKAYYTSVDHADWQRQFGRFCPLSRTGQEIYTHGTVLLHIPPHFNGWVFFELREIYDLKVRLYSEAYRRKHLKREDWVQALFTGGILALFLYNLILFVGTKDRIYLYYFMYIVTAATYYFNAYGYFVQFFFPESPHYAVYCSNLSTCSSIFFILFMRRFTNTARLMPRWDKFLNFHPYTRLVCNLLIVVFFYVGLYRDRLSHMAVFMTLMEGVIFVIPTLVLLFLSKAKMARLFIIAAGVMVFSILISQLLYFSYPFIAEHIGQFGILAESILLSVGLSYRIKKIQNEKQEVQLKLIEQLEENKKLQESAHLELERRVDDRTAELKATNENLNLVNEELKLSVDTVNHQNKIIHKKNKDITAGINYAKRIQDAILPRMARIKSIFPDSFVLFRPRDIVSGDFYFFSKKTDRVIIVGADSTGHGVPGAFMSLIGNTFFNQIINIQQIYSPDVILERMRTSIQTMLKQDQTGGRDGMEVGICVLHGNLQNGFSRLEFAGAGHDLYFFDRSDQLQVLKGNRIFIGGISNSQGQFKKCQITLPDKCTLYLFSDGYMDQFGGQNGRKFMKKRFQKLLTDIQSMSMAQQKKILEKKHQAWRGDKYNQLDDILVMGIRL